jgi:hypothetical protein
LRKSACSVHTRGTGVDSIANTARRRAQCFLVFYAQTL